jgi:hypothetical protein
MRKIIFVATILTVIFMICCSLPLKQSLYNIRERSIPREKIYDNYFEVVWKACENVLIGSKVTINAKDKDSGLLTYTIGGIDPSDIKKISGGVSMGGNLETRSDTTLHVSMLLTTIDDNKTRIRIHSLFRTPYSHLLFSNGLIEEELFKKIELKLKELGGK